jgi:hypothetical protein
MSVTVPAPITHHVTAYVVAALAAVALVVSLAVGMAIAGSDSTSTVRHSGSGVTQELPTRFGEGRSTSQDLVGRPAPTDSARHAANAAAERNR